MVRVITYGTFDMLHYGHVRLLERAKELGDYLVVGITSDAYDISRGKINVKQSLSERIEAVKSLGIVDEIIVEEYPGQKIDDICRMSIDIFAIGSDWRGQFDYLSKYCKVIYLERTQGVSSTELRTRERKVRLGFVGEVSVLNKFFQESKYVNGVEIKGVYAQTKEELQEEILQLPCVTDNYSELLECVDAVYIISHPSEHYEHIKQAIECGVHVLCEAPLVTNPILLKELKELAKEKKCLILDALKTAYSTAYSRLLLLVKSGVIGEVFSVDATCTSLRSVKMNDRKSLLKTWNSICTWGPVAMLPVFQLLGTNYINKTIVTSFADREALYDKFTKIDFVYSNAVASIKVGKGVKSEGELIISGTKGYIYVPAPWWKTDYFEVRYENPEMNRRYFYQLEGEGIRYELVAFVKAIEKGNVNLYIEEEVSEAIVKVICDFYSETDRVELE